MIPLVTSVMSTLEQIQSLDIKAVCGGSLLIFIGLVVAIIFNKNSKIFFYSFVFILAILAIVSGILIASAVYSINNLNTNVFFVGNL